MGAKVLVVGGGGREYAFGYGLAQSEAVSQLFFAPGNGGTTELGENVAVADTEIPAWAEQNAIDLVVVGPEAYLVAGLADRLREAGLPVCGASAAAAQLEGSKAFAAEFMEEADIPQPDSQTITGVEEGLAAIQTLGGSLAVVIKADGLAAGKGVFLPESDDDAKDALEQIFSGRVQVDGQGMKTVIQKRFHGPEASVFVLSDGEEYYVIPVAAQDHKRLLDGDKGPNTGGMGVYAPIPRDMLGSKQWQKIHTIAAKTIVGMQKRGTPYQGFLYIGLMLAEELDGDPIVIEYNVRFGDPEAQVLIPLLVRAGADMYQAFKATAVPGALKDMKLPDQLDECALTVVLAAEGYPESPKKGDVIEGLNQKYTDVVVCHAGTKSEGGKIVVSGGRVLNVTGFGRTLPEAAKAAYAVIGDSDVHFRGMQYRKDIGHRAMN